jgi:phage shock protein A
MSLLKDIVAAIRGGAKGVTDLLSEQNSISALEQDIHSVAADLLRAKEDLTEAIAKHMHSSREISALRLEIANREEQARLALAQEDETLALKIAEAIAELDADLAEQEQVNSIFSGHVARLRSLVHKTERQIKDYQRQLEMVKTTESIQKASEAISSNYASSSTRMLSARDSLERIRERQQRSLDVLEAEQELLAKTGEKTLEERLEQAGIADTKVNVSAVLNRIKKDQP